MIGREIIGWDIVEHSTTYSFDKTPYGIIFFCSTIIS